MTHILSECLKLLSSFSLQLLTAELMYCFFLERRGRFWLRLIPSAVLFLLLTYDMPFYTFEDWSSYRFLLTFLLSVLVMLWSFKESLSAVLFCSVAGYASRSLVMNLILLIRFYIPTTLDDSMDPLTYLMFLIIYPLLYVTLARQLKVRNFDIENKQLIIVSLAVVLLSEIMNIWKWVLLLPDNPICPLYGAVSCMFVLLVQFQFFREKKLKKKNAMLEQLFRMEREKYELSRKNIELINMKAHDMKHCLTMLKEAGETESVKKYCQELEKSVSDYDNVPNTGNAALDTVLREKQWQFEAHGIEFTYFANGALLKIMDDLDIYALFGNILSNACAREEQEAPERRFISFSVSEKANQIYIHQDNYCSVPVKFAEDMPQTSGDPSIHGFGSKSIKYIVEKYQGLVRFSYADSRFSVDILIPLNQEPQTDPTASEGKVF